MSFTATKRFCDLTTRWLEVNWNEILKDGHRFYEGEAYIQILNFKNVRVTVASHPVWHNHLCDGEDNQGRVTEDCNECDAECGTEFVFAIQHWKIKSNNDTVFTEYKTVIHKEDAYVGDGYERYKQAELENTILKIREWEGKTWDTCKHCEDEPVYKNDLCEDCYIYDYERTEEEGGECCICRENGGKWVKLSTCGHILHLTCCKKIECNVDKKKCCPLCREPWLNPGECLFTNLILSPYDP